MTERAFSVASEEKLIYLIRKATQRLVVVCPALTDPVAIALTERFVDLGIMTINVIVDADPEVYRLGYGTEAALDRLRKAAVENLFDLRVQPGVRIGLVISDDIAMVFCPVPKLIEAGSTSVEKPNAIILSGASSDRLADAAGAGQAALTNMQEIGGQALTPPAVEALKADLKANRPQTFHIARALGVFSSKVQYVEFQAENYRFSTRRVALPRELLNITDEKLKHQISGSIQAQAGVIGPFEIKVKTAQGEQVVKADEKWLSSERKRIEDKYTFVVNKYGRAILSADRPAFDSEVKTFECNLQNYHREVLKTVEALKSDFEEKLIKEYLPKWIEHPPANFARYRVASTDGNLEKELREVIKKLSSKAISFGAPIVRVIYKNIAPESVTDPNFLEPLKKNMERRGVPRTVIDSLFASGDAAPASRTVAPHLL